MVKKSFVPSLSTLFGLLLMTCSLPPSALAQESAILPLSWALLTGYGSSHPGWGDTEERVETVDLVLRHQRHLAPDTGSSWLRGHHSLLIELPIHFLVNSDEPPMVGLTFLAHYRFAAGETLHPYVFAGGGPMYVPGDIEGMGARLNGNYQVGAGLEIAESVGKAWLLEIRYHHISNADRADPNVPLNSAKFLFGIVF